MIQHLASDYNKYLLRRKNVSIYMAKVAIMAILCNSCIAKEGDQLWRLFRIEAIFKDANVLRVYWMR